MSSGALETGPQHNLIAGVVAEALQYVETRLPDVQPVGDPVGELVMRQQASVPLPRRSVPVIPGRPHNEIPMLPATPVDRDPGGRRSHLNQTAQALGQAAARSGNPVPRQSQPRYEVFDSRSGKHYHPGFGVPNATPFSRKMTPLFRAPLSIYADAGAWEPGEQ